MIYASINGRTAYPASGQSIKLVLENPFMKQQGNHTYQVSFPLDIPQNRNVFGNVNRIEVTKPVNTFEECSLFAGTNCLIRGSATVLEYSDTAVKIQILGSSSDVKTRWGEKYLDTLDFTELNVTHKEWCRKSSVNIPSQAYSDGYAGQRNKYLFFTLANESTGKKYNRMKIYNQNFKCYLKRPVIQPGLIYVLHEVFRIMGYTVKTDVFSTYPWNDLYILNLRRATRIADALPHWKVSTFLEEFRKLFNAVYIYDEKNMTVSIQSYDDMDTFGTEEIDCDTEFTSEYDEDGVSYTGSDNIAYDLVTCAEQSTVREIPDEIFSSFEVREYDKLTEAVSAAAAMEEKEKFTTLFLAKDTGYVYFRKDDDGNTDFAKCGFFNKLVKEGNKLESSTTSLKIIPAPMGEIPVNSSDNIEDTCFMPSIEGPEWGNTTEDEYITTLQDVLEDEVSIEKEEEDTHMAVAFPAFRTDRFGYNPDKTYYAYFGVMRCYVDARESGLTNSVSMALSNPGSIYSYIGKFHDAKVSIDAKKQYVFKFPYEGIPDQRKVFLVRNKRFLCAKIEVTVTDNGIDNLKTGYFYEIIS